MTTVRGIGLGLRRAFADELIGQEPAEIDWLEVHPENYIGRGGPFARHLEQASSRWSLIPHGLTTCFGNEPAGDEASWHRDLRVFLDDINAPFFSDHLCVSGVGGAHSHDLLPMVRNRQSIAWAVDRIRALSDVIGRPVAVENVSAYAGYPGDMPEHEFLAEVVGRADALLLLDVNNLVVNRHNFGFDPEAWLRTVPLGRVAQIHVAGHEIAADGMRIDTHAEDVDREVFALLGQVIRRIGDRPILLERDANIPRLSELLDELRLIRAVRDAALLESAELAESTADSSRPAPMPAEVHPGV